MVTFSKKFVLTIDANNTFDLDAEGLKEVIDSLREEAPEYFPAQCDAGACAKFDQLKTENAELRNEIRNLRLMKEQKGIFSR